MEATEKNYQLAQEILAILAKENCTVLDAEDVLSFVRMTIRRTATVQLAKTISPKRRRSGCVCRLIRLMRNGAGDELLTSSVHPEKRCGFLRRRLQSILNA